MYLTCLDLTAKPTSLPSAGCRVPSVGESNLMLRIHPIVLTYSQTLSRLPAALCAFYGTHASIDDVGGPQEKLRVLCGMLILPLVASDSHLQ